MCINNCFNYVGSKDRILPKIDNNLDKNKKYLIDVFCGSGVVGVNETTNYSKIVLNDMCWQLTETLRYLRTNKHEDTIKELDKVIEEYGLSKTNKEGYLKLRDYYNSECSQRESFSPIHFYLLCTHSFNYNIHINKSGGFSVPFGMNRSYFSNSLRTKLKNFQDMLYTYKGNITIKTLSFNELVHSMSDKAIKDSMFYLDPPYLSSDDAYSRIYYLGKWDATKEKLLYDTIDYIHEKGGSFLLSNVIENNGSENTTLIEWSKKYNIVDVSADYTNCNYQRKNKGNTREVMIRNY